MNGVRALTMRPVYYSKFLDSFPLLGGHSVNHWMTFALGRMGARCVDRDHPSSKTLWFRVRVDLTKMVRVRTNFNRATISCTTGTSLFLSSNPTLKYITSHPPPPEKLFPSSQSMHLRTPPKVLFFIPPSCTLFFIHHHFPSSVDMHKSLLLLHDTPLCSKHDLSNKCILCICFVL